MDLKSKATEFEAGWKASFPKDPVPRLTCFESTNTADSMEAQQQSFRSLLQATLDYHNIRISDLKRKLKQQQFILEYVAKELEQIPVPRHTLSYKPPQSDSKPLPRPRKPPAIPKKPKALSADGDNSQPGAIRRIQSAPSSHKPPAVEKRMQYSSVYVSSPQSIEEEVEPTSDLLEQSTDSALLMRGDSTDERFNTFQGTTFGSSIKKPQSKIAEEEMVTSTNAVSNPNDESPAIISNRIQSSSDYESLTLKSPQSSRSSMKKLAQLGVPDVETSSCASSPDATSGDYMQLWTTKPLANVKADAASPSSEVSHSLSDSY